MIRLAKAIGVRMEVWGCGARWQNDESLPLLAPSRGSVVSDSFPFWHRAEVWQGWKCPSPGGLISVMLPLPKEDVEVSSQHFVSYCVAAFRNCQALAFSHPGEGLHHGIFRKKESRIAPPLLSLWLPPALYWCLGGGEEHRSPLTHYW